MQRDGRTQLPFQKQSTAAVCWERSGRTEAASSFVRVCADAGVVSRYGPEAASARTGAATLTNTHGLRKNKCKKAQQASKRRNCLSRIEREAHITQVPNWSWWWGRKRDEAGKKAIQIAEGKEQEEYRNRAGFSLCVRSWCSGEYDRSYVPKSVKKKRRRR